MKRPSSRGAVPIGGYCRYTDPDAGFKIAHPYYDFCKSQAKAERIKRGLAIPFDWDGFFDDQFCEATPQACFDVPETPIETGPSWIKLAVQFGASAFNWARSGFATVTWDQYKQRHLKCTGDETHSRCPHFTKFAVFGVSKCGGCGCSTGVKLWLATEACPKSFWPKLK